MGGHDTIAETPEGIMASAPTLDGPPTPVVHTSQLPLVGRRLGGRFEVVAVIGKGGLGTVYRGVQHPIGREVAIKVINRQRAGDEVLRLRFEREASAAAALKHPNIVALYDYGEDEGELYMAMELLDGRELRALMLEAKRLEPAFVVQIARQVCDGLAHAHGRGLVHRDLKPENIMISNTSFGEPRAQILDFGIVKAIREDALVGSADHETRAGVIMGTPAYLAPEQAYARGIGPATDQYSLAVVLYEMLTGKLPFDKGSEFEIMTAHCIAPYPEMPEEAGVPAALEAVVRRAMGKVAEDRYESVGAFADALEAALAAPEVASAPVAPPPRRGGWIWAGAALAVGGALAALLWPGPGPTSSEADAAVVVAAPPAADVAEPVIGDAAPPPDARPSAPDVAVAAVEPPRPVAPVTRAPATRPRRVRVSRIVKDCAQEFAALKRGALKQSLSRGSGLCRRVLALGRRARAGQCKTPVVGIDTLVALCEE